MWIGMCVGRWWYGYFCLDWGSDYAQDSGRSLAWHWHGVWGHVHLKSHYGIVCSCGWLLRLHALVRVKSHVFLLACSVWVMRCTALLCLVILRHFRYEFSHIDRRWGHVSLSLLWMLLFGMWGAKIYFPRAYPCVGLNFRVWIIRVSDTLSFCQKWLESFWFFWVWVFDNHLSRCMETYFWLIKLHSLCVLMLWMCVDCGWSCHVWMLGYWLANRE